VVIAVRARWPLIATASALLAGALVLGGVQSPVRVLVVLWFVLVCPGIAVVRLLGLGDPVAELTLAVTVSIALAAVVSGVMLYTGLWSPHATLFVLIAFTASASAVGHLPRRSKDVS
jgi:uncharacterized membrane protein